MGDKAASFQMLRKLKSDIDQMKTIEVTRLPSTTYNRKNVKVFSLQTLCDIKFIMLLTGSSSFQTVFLHPEL
jgi:hypothetical protein